MSPIQPRSKGRKILHQDREQSIYSKPSMSLLEVAFHFARVMARRTRSSPASKVMLASAVYRQRYCFTRLWIRDGGTTLLCTLAGVTQQRQRQKCTYNSSWLLRSGESETDTPPVDAEAGRDVVLGSEFVYSPTVV